MREIPGVTFPGLVISQESHGDGTSTVTCTFPTLGEKYETEWATPYPLAMDEFWSEVHALVVQVHWGVTRGGYRPQASIRRRRNLKWERQ